MSRGPDPHPAQARVERRAGNRASAWVDLAIMVGAFVIASALAGLLGAIDLGTALAFGQMAFAAAAVYVLLRR